MALLYIVFGGLAFVIFTLWKRLTAEDKIPKGLKKLPGPKGLPVIGSVHELNDLLSGTLQFHEWGQKYGPIYQVNLAGTNHVWISSDEIARDLLSKKAAIYSDRPHIPALIDDNRTSAQYLPLLSRNDGWTRQRKFANHIMRNSEKADFLNYPELESIRMLKELIDQPERYNHILESFIARVTSRLAWGHSEASDELKQRARELLIGVSPTGAMGNKLPFLMALPDWLSPAKAWERRRAKTERAFFQIMQGQVKSEIEEKKAPPSWMKYFFDDNKGHGFAGELEGAYAVGMHGIAGALTIAAPMQDFCLAMLHYPQYLPMLQEELDRVCGDRLPTNADKPNLPFLRAVIRELFRWRPAVPTGIPHFLIEDDDYKGYHIPKGSVMHPLEWSISRDTEFFPDPETFNPMRWLKPEYPTYKEPLSQFPTIMNCSQFGYGRRTCQGQTVSEADLVVGISSIAWLFNIGKVSPPSEISSRSTTPPLSPKSQFLSEKSIMTNTNASISNEELVTGMSDHSSDDDAEFEDGSPRTQNHPGSFPKLTLAESKEHYAAEQEKQKKKAQEVEKDDPKLHFTTLLIAKPVPFKFELTVRNKERAAMVEQLFAEQREKGEFVESREYWGVNQGAGKELGWGKV